MTRKPYMNWGNIVDKAESEWRHRVIWKNLERFGEIWRSLEKFGEVWRALGLEPVGKGCFGESTLLSRKSGHAPCCHLVKRSNRDRIRLVDTLSLSSKSSWSSRTACFWHKRSLPFNKLKTDQEFLFKETIGSIWLWSGEQDIGRKLSATMASLAWMKPDAYSCQTVTIAGIWAEVGRRIRR